MGLGRRFPVIGGPKNKTGNPMKVLNLMRTYFHAHLEEALAMLGEMEEPRERAR